jgi:hypothetical protein
VRVVLAALASVVVPCLAIGQTFETAQPTFGFRVLSVNNDGIALVVEENTHFFCKITDRSDFLELTDCREILSASQVASRADQYLMAELAERFEAIPLEVDEVSLLSLFAVSGCEVALGRDYQYEEPEFAPDLLPLGLEADPFSDVASSPLQTNLPSIQDTKSRADAVRQFGVNLGFSDTETQLLMERLYHRFEWTIRSLVDQGVIVEVRSGFFNLQERCN